MWVDFSITIPPGHLKDFRRTVSDFAARKNYLLVKLLNYLLLLPISLKYLNKVNLCKLEKQLFGWVTITKL